MRDAPTIPNYRILSRLGGGGMGEVFLAQHLGLGRMVALKVVDLRTQGQADVRARMVREARALAAINHPQVVTCFDMGEDGGYLYLAMEVVSGGDCARMLAQGRLAPKRALAILRDAAAGLQALHDAGLVHRDIKPSNILIDQHGRAKLADLGLVRAVADADHLTASNAVVGTPAFLSPEQAMASPEVDARSDLYSLGSTLFALVTGEHPFSGASPWLIVAAILKAPTPDPRRVVPDLAQPVRALIRRCMARDPRVRFASATQLIAAIDRCSALLAAPPPPRWRSWLVRGAGVLLAGAALAALAIGLWHLQRSAASAAIADHGAAPTAASDHPDARPPTASGHALVALPVRPAPAVTVAAVATDSARPAADAPPREAWAAAQGQDRLGSWSELALGDQRIRLRWCPPGSFVMGSPPDEPGRYGNEQAHPVSLTRGVWLAATEVTQRQWQSVLGDAPSLHVGADLPVERISWRDCQRFVRALSAASHAPVRLPSEAEWEHACRAGTTGPYHGRPDQLSWNRANAQGQEHAVGTRAANPLGLQDMYGNVWEWCQDSYAPLGADAAADPVVDGSLQHVIRGGSYRYDAADCRSSLRDGADQDARRETIGMRLAVSAGADPSR